MCLVAILGIAPEWPGPAQAAGVIDPSCSSGSPCIEYDNSGSGPAIRGVALGSGNGIGGQTTFKSTSASNGRAGVVGVDSSTSGGFNIGVKGSSTNGTGVYGTTGVPFGTLSPYGNGVSGIATASANGVYGSSFGGEGVFGNGGDSGVFGFGKNHGVHGLAIAGDGVFGDSNSGYGMLASSGNWVGAKVVGGGLDSATGDVVPALAITSNGSYGGSTLIEACPAGSSPHCESGSSVFGVDGGGDVVISGFIFTGGSCHSGCAIKENSTHDAVRFYTPQESLPSVEDVGEAELVGGRAEVRIDPAFADTMDQRATYMVVITPEGDTNGLYVTAKTPSSFEVHEN